MNKAGPYGLHFLANEISKLDTKNARIIDDNLFRQAIVLFGLTITEIVNIFYSFREVF
jgi:hypothetical protein